MPGYELCWHKQVSSGIAARFMTDIMLIKTPVKGKALKTEHFHQREMQII